jgi:hypothetical protein
MVRWGDVPTWLAVLGAYPAAGAALWQLRLQRIQLGEQKQQLAQQTRIQERAQADKVGILVWPPESLPDRPGIVLAAVLNESSRPIRDVRCGIAFDEHQPRYMEWLGVNVDWDQSSALQGSWDRFGRPPGATVVMRRGSTHGFEYRLTDHPNEGAGWSIVTRFTDDAGLCWQIDPDLHLHKLDQRDW